MVILCEVFVPIFFIWDITIVDGKQVEVQKPNEEITITYNVDSDHEEISEEELVSSSYGGQQNRNDE